MNGRYSENRALPTEAELSRCYEVSRHTVRRAFQDLVGEGLVYRVPGRGTFASELPKSGRYLRSVGTIEDLEAWAGSEMEITSPVHLRQNPEISGRLNLDSSVVAALELRRIKGGAPFGLTRIYLSPDTGRLLTEADALPRHGRGTVIGIIQRLLPRAVARAEQVITAVPMPAEVARAIDGQENEPCLRVERTYVDARGEPIEVAITHYNPARYSYRIDIKRQTD